MVENINNIQLRAARHAVGLGVREIAELLGVASSTASNQENEVYGKKACDEFMNLHSAKLIDYFKNKHDIVFPNESSIELNVSKEVLNNLPKEGGELTRFQLRCARCVLNISQAELSKNTGISLFLLKRKESKKNIELLYRYKPEEKAEVDLKQWFENHGLVFIEKFTINFENFSVQKTQRLLKSKTSSIVKQKKEVMPA